MSLTVDQLALLRSALIKILADQTMNPNAFTWSTIENGINNLTQDEKDYIAKSLVSADLSAVSLFIKEKLRASIEKEVAVEVDSILDTGLIPIDFVSKVLL
jgi:hypothetical protein